MTAARAIYNYPALQAARIGWRRLDPEAPPEARLPERALQFWNERPDLQSAFDLTRIEGREALFWWCLRHGFRETGIRFDPALDGDFLVANEPYPTIRQAAFLPITYLMRALWAGSPLSKGSLREPAEQEACLAHYFAHELLDANLGGLLTADQARTLLEDDPTTNVPRLFALIWHCDPTLQERFGSPRTDAFAAWCRSDGARDWPILSHPLVRLAAVPERKIRRGRSRGVNLFGHVFGRLGIGEDVRMAAKSLEAVSIPFVIRNVTAEAAGEEEGLDGMRLADSSPHDINLFCMTGISTVGANLAAKGELMQERYSIGCWPWELPEWPNAWDHAYDHIDEIWAASRFTYASYMRSATVPVLHLTSAVVADASEGCQRADFGLPEHAFLFCFSFDGLSSLARKNPSAVVAAFRKAFPASERGVGLVLKGIRAPLGSAQWSDLAAAIADDERIIFIDQSLSRGRLLDLYRCINVYVSLHRSEGFGRNVAEAMLLGKPVIVTAHSGNMDFTLHDNAALVPARLRTVRQGEYPYGAGQLWADPDIDAASEAMRRMIADRTWREGLAERGQAFIAHAHSPQAVGEAWSRRLEALF
jgi:glycosyltransferase involved in cell wall biosynthesis